MPKALPIDKQGPSWEKTKGEGCLGFLRGSTDSDVENIGFSQREGIELATL